MYKKNFFQKIIFSIIAISLLGFSLVGTISAVKVQIPEGDRQSDVMVTPQESQIDTNTGEKDIFELIQIINKYLRFSIGAVALVGLVVGGFRLLTSEGNEEANKKTSKMLMGAAIGLAIAMLSYAAIRLIVNLF